MRRIILSTLVAMAAVTMVWSNAEAAQFGRMAFVNHDSPSHHHVHHHIHR